MDTLSFEGFAGPSATFLAGIEGADFWIGEGLGGEAVVEKLGVGLTSSAFIPDS